MKKREVYAVFWYRRLRIRCAWCFFFVFSLPTSDSTLQAEAVSGSQTNVRTASDNRALPANVAAGSANASVPASANGSMRSSTDTIRNSATHASSAVGSKAVASDTASSAGISVSNHPASNAVNSSQPSAVPTRTASANTANNVPAGSSATASGTTGTTATATDATGSATLSGSINTTISTTPSATGSASTAPNVANFSPSQPVPANIPVGSPAVSGANNVAPTPEEEKPQDLGDILDLRPPAKLKVSLLPWFVALLVVLSAVGLWFLLKRKRRGRAKKEKPMKPIDPYEEVLQALKEASQKLDVINPKPFAFFLTDAVRLYLSRIFRLPAPESTTEELLSQLPWCVELTDDLRTNITQFLQRCDLVKFTTMPFDEPFLLQLYQQAEAIVAASREITKPKPAPVAFVAPSSKPERMSKK